MYPGIELRLLRYASVVAEELNFTRAAARLHVSQPSLSRQIRQLEDALGFKLFRRTNRWVDVTPAGHRFVEEARKALAHANRAVEAAKRASVAELEICLIGYSPCIDLHLLSAIRRIRAADAMQFVFRSATYSELVAKLVAHEWEAALMLLPIREPQLNVEPLFREPLAAGIPPSHPLAKKHELAVTDLRGEPILLAPKCYGPAFSDYLLHQLEKAGTHVMSHEAASPHEAIHLVSEGFGIALAQESVLAEAKERIAVSRIKSSDTEVGTGIVFHEENDSPILQKLLEAVRLVRDRHVASRGRKLLIPA